MAGGLLGVFTAFAFFRYNAFTLGNEGQTLAITPDLPVLASGLLVSLATGLLASLFPAWKATRQPIVTSLRTS